MDDIRYLWDENNPKGYGNRMGTYKKTIELGFIMQCINPTTKTILDIGGGSGRMATSLKALGSAVTIIDYNSEAVILAKERGIRAYCNDIMDYDDPEQYNIIVAIESLDYIENKLNFFEKITDFLDDKGFFIFTIPNINSWRYILRNLKNKKTNYFHESYQTYLRIINDTGLELVDSKGFMWIPLSVNSNSRLVYLFQYIEKYLRLYKYLAQSPWLIISCRKQVRKD